VNPVNSHTVAFMNKAEAAMIHPEITSLFKYRAFNDFALESLEFGKIWLSRPSSFNDPFDCSIDVINNLNDVKNFRELFRRLGKMRGLSKKSVQTITDHYLHKGKVSHLGQHFIEEFLPKLSVVLSDIGVFCLSEIPDDILMWSHYGDQHKGFCVEYTRTNRNILGKLFVDAFIKHKYPNQGFETYEPRTHRVIYSDLYPDINFTQIFENGEALDKLVLTKSKQWSYEREWRIVVHTYADRAITIDAEIASIIFGLKMPKKHQDEIKNILRQNSSVRYFQTVKDSRNFSLKIEEAE
jgi:DUF2971 family protein